MTKKLPIFKTKEHRTFIFSIISFVIGCCYAIFNAVFGIIESSSWFGSLAAYYILITILRGSVAFKNYKENIKKENNIATTSKLKLSIFCGIFLIITIVSLSFAILQMVLKQNSFKYVGLMIYVAAIYTFAKLTLSIINFIKTKRKNDITIQTLRNINLADSTVSILALQTAMFQSFSNGQDMSAANAATGAGVCAFILFLGIYMIVKAIKQLNKIEVDSDV